MKNKFLKIIHLIGGLLTFSGIILDFLDYENSTWIFIAGSVILIIVQFIYMLQSKSKDVRKQRIVRLMFISSIILGIGAYLMYMGNGYWIVMVLTYALISIFLALRN